MNFYDLKSKLNFARLAGAIRQKSDLFALMQPNREMAGKYWDLAMLVSLNSNSHNLPYEEDVEIALTRFHDLHMQDVKAIQKYMVEHKMIE